LRNASVNKLKNKERCSFNSDSKRKKKSSCKKRNGRRKKRCYLSRSTTRIYRRKLMICAILFGNFERSIRLLRWKSKIFKEKISMVKKTYLRLFASLKKTLSLQITS